MYDFKKRLVSLTSAAALVISGINVPATQAKIYADDVTEAQVTGEKAKGWTFGLYLCGQDLEEYRGSATMDLMEILKADVPEGFSKDNNIIVETGGCYDWHFKQKYSEYLKEEKHLSKREISQIVPFEIDSEKLSQYKVNFEFEYTADDGTKKTIPTLEFIKDVADYDVSLLDRFDDDESTIDDEESDVDEMLKSEDETNIDDEVNDVDAGEYANMGDEKYLSAFLEDLDKNYPAEHMVLDLWNHGGGITGGVCYDEYYDDPITLGELKNVLKNRKEAGYDKLDILGYDACLMSNYDSWMNISDYVKYGVGSLTSEPGFGWNYTPFIEDLGANYTDEDYDVADFASSMVDAFKEYYVKDGESYNQLITEAIEEDGIDEEEASALLDEFFGSAVLCAVDLEKLSKTSDEFATIGDDLFMAYADSEGVKSIFNTALENGMVEDGFEIVEISKLLDAISEIAPERVEALSESSNPYHKVAVSAYEKILEDIEEFKAGVNDSLVNTYTGYETFRLYDSLGMSIFVPEQIKDHEIAIFNADEYPGYAVSSSYAKLVYLYASDIELEDVNDIEFIPQYKYDAKTGMLSLGVNDEAMPYVNSMDAFSYVEVNGKTYLSRSYSNDRYTPGETFKVFPELKYISLDGKTPIKTSVYESFDDGIRSQEVFIYGYLNGKYGRFNFDNDTKTGEIYFTMFTSFEEDEDDFGESDELKVGDKVKFECEIAKEVKYLLGEESSKNLEKIYTDEYVIKASDKKEYTHESSENFKVVLKRFSPQFKYVEADGDKCSIVMGFSSFGINSEDEDDMFFFGRNSEEDLEAMLPIIESKTINVGKLKTFADSKLSIEKKEFELTGEAITPKVVFEKPLVKLVEGKDYKVTYENNIGLGKAKVIVTPLGDLDFLDVREVEFDIVKVKAADKKKVVYVTVVVKEPKKVKVKSVKNNKKNAFTVKWKKVKGAKGYQVKYALNKKLTKGKKVKTIKNAKKLSLTIKKLKKNKTYFVKVRAYKVVKNGKKVYGDWSEVKKVKICK